MFRRFTFDEILFCFISVCILWRTSNEISFVFRALNTCTFIRFETNACFVSPFHESSRNDMFRFKVVKSSRCQVSNAFFFDTTLYRSWWFNSERMTKMKREWVSSILVMSMTAKSFYLQLILPTLSLLFWTATILPWRCLSYHIMYMYIFYRFCLRQWI